MTDVPLEVDHLLDTLLALREPQGGWSYVPGQVVQMEPTVLALLALARAPRHTADAVAQGRAFLEQARSTDGGFRTNTGWVEAIWPTSLALFLQAALDVPDAERRRTAARLLGSAGKAITDPRTAPLQDIDTALVGWPWAEDNFSWAEPTAWACLALRHAGFGSHARVTEGRRLLLDRTFETGGINYGNRRVLNKMTDPVPGPTAVMLIAQQPDPSQSGPSDLPPRVRASLDYLHREALERGHLDELCWAKLALELYRGEPGIPEALALLDARIRTAFTERATRNWARPSPLRLALTALALGTDQGNPFRLKAVHSNGAALVPVKPASKPLGERVGAFVRRLAVEALHAIKPPLTEPARVHIARAATYDVDLLALLTEQYGFFRDKVPLAGKRVVLKPNFVEYHPFKVINTDPRVIEAAIQLCRNEGAAEVIVGEGPGHWRNIEYVIAASGLGDVLSRHNVPFVDLNHDQPVKRPNLGRLTRLDALYFARTAVEADVLISMPKLKTHHWQVATLSLKNLFGIMSGICYGWPKNELHWRGIQNSIIDIALTRTPELAIVDGIVGMEGDGPLNGTAKPCGALVMGTDLLAVDATCCRLMGIDPETVPYLRLGVEKKLGRHREIDIEQLGVAIATLATTFQLPPKSALLPQGQPA